MLTLNDLKPEQEFALGFGRERDRFIYMLDMGFGKTCLSLTIAQERLDNYRVTNVLVVAPLKVANTVWHNEIAKWEHLAGLTWVKLTDSNIKKRLEKISTAVDITIINREKLTWLIDNAPWIWDMVIFDESSSYKNHRSKRFRAIRKVLPKIKCSILLTGTPMPKGYIDLWTQAFMVDRGERLGKTIGIYRRKHFVSAGFKGYDYELRDDKKDKLEIDEKLKDVCLSMELDRAPPIMIPRYVDIPDKVKKQYKELKDEAVLELDNGVEITSEAEGSSFSKLLQISNGFIYDEERKAHSIHSAKVDELRQIRSEMQNENLLIGYTFRHDINLIKKAFPNAVVMDKKGEMVESWNKGEIRELIVHPASAGHGLNMQFGGSVLIYFGLPTSLELYKQLNKRLDREGQKKAVRIIQLIADTAVDRALLKNLARKDLTERQFLKAVRRDIE